MKVCIIGQGYIGLPTAALFTRNHCEVVGVDVNEEVVNKLNQGIIHIEEPTKKWQCATISCNTIHIFAVESVKSCRYSNLARFDIWHQLSAIGGTIIEYFTLLKELRRCRRHPCNEEHRKNHTFHNSFHISLTLCRSFIL